VTLTLRGFPLERTRLPILALSALLLAVVFAACNGDSDSGDTAAEVEVPTRWATAHAESVEALTQFADEVFVGRVARLPEQREVTIGSGLPENSTRQPTFPLSRYEVTVEEAVLGSLAAGSVAVMEQVGGLVANDGGPGQRVVLEGDEPLEPGATYLFFANEKSNGSYSSAPFARLRVGSGQDLSVPAVWSHLPALQALSGSTVGQAAAEVVSVGP
jgi:hypothetical protein